MSLNVRFKHLNGKNILLGEGGARMSEIPENQFIFSNGCFDTPGDAQASSFVVRGVSTDTENAELFLDGTDARIILENNTSYFFTTQLLGRDSSGNTVALVVDGAAKRGANATLTQHIGKPQVRIVCDEIGIQDVQFDVNITNGAFKFYVIGKASTTIRWVGRVELTQLRFSV
jgi:hypothetical protein